MVVTKAQIKSDVEGIFADLAGTDAIKESTATTPSLTFDCIRLGRMTTEELGDPGWILQYDQSIRALTDDITGLVLETVLTIDATEYRVLNIDNGAMNVLTRIDLGHKLQP